jgi:glutamate-1-semialdehyde 2,1-aminomutase
VAESAPAAAGVSANRQLFEQNTPGSRAAWTAALGVLPGGVSGAAKYYAPYPVFLERGEGGRVRDVDGNEYVDLLMGAGSVLLGHCDRRVAAAVARQLERLGTVLAPTALEREYAERLRAHMPYLERLRFANTGSEANRSALRAARAFTGRTRYAKFEGNYHGSDDYFLFSSVSRSTLGPAQRPEPVIDSHGVPASLTRDVVMLPFNDAQGAGDLILAHGDDLAAVFMEPMAFSTGGAIVADTEFSQAVREATAATGALLVFDEVVTALRLGLAGAPGYLGVTPDLSCIGKAVGGGLPLAAFGGRADVMDDVLGLDDRHHMFHSGTFTANPVSIAAGAATLDVLESEPVLDHIDRLGARLRGALETVCRRHQLGHVTGVGSVLQLHVTAQSPRNRRDVLAGDLDVLADVLLGVCANGVLWPPIHPAVLCAAHTDADVDRVIEAVDRAMSRVA